MPGLKNDRSIVRRKSQRRRRFLQPATGVPEPKTEICRPQSNVRQPRSGSDCPVNAEPCQRFPIPFDESISQVRPSLRRGRVGAESFGQVCRSPCSIAQPQVAVRLVGLARSQGSTDPGVRVSGQKLGNHKRQNAQPEQGEGNLPNYFCCIHAVTTTFETELPLLQSHSWPEHICTVLS